MNRGLIVMAAVAIGVGAFAGEVRTTYGANAELVDSGISFSPIVFTPEWHSYGAGGDFNEESDGRRRFSMGTDRQNAPTLRGTLICRQSGDAVRVEYALSVERDFRINQLCITARLKHSDFAGGQAVQDDYRAELPDDKGLTHFFNHRGKKFSITDAMGKPRLTMDFDEPTHIAMQDNREWNDPSFSIRVFLAESRQLKTGEEYRIAFNITDGGKTVLSQEPGGMTVSAGKDWIPMKLDAEIAPGGPLDFSKLRGTESPAGKYGYVVARGQNFEFERLPGVSQRFYGVNVCFDANVPDYETAHRFARHLARVGYNAIRFHHHESSLVQQDGVTLNPEKMKCFDGLVAACVENGIYMTTDLFVSRRPISYRSIGIDQPGSVEMNEFKELVQAHDGAFENYLKFARNFLGHVNQYTGRTLAAEPAMSWLSFVNEGNLGNHGMTWMAKHPVFAEKWAAWLEDKKRAEPAVYADVKPELPKSLDNRKDPQVWAYVLFLQDLETRFAARVTKFLRDEMKCRALTTNLNNWHYPAAFQLVRAKSYDYVDDHFYVDHPSFLEHSWRLPSQCKNENPFLNPSLGAQALVMRRILDKPFTITEYNFAAPGNFRGVGGIACGTAAALQNWAGLWRFAWSHNQQGVAHPDQRPLGYFDMCGDPLGLASERASICLFLRRDLKPLDRTYAMLLSEPALHRPEAAMWLRSDWNWASWYVKTGGLVADAAPENTGWKTVGFPECLNKKSDEVRREILPESADGPFPPAGNGAVEIDRQSGRFVLKTPRTCGGFGEGGVIRADALTAELDSSATIWASSLDSLPIRESRHLLVTHLTDVQNSGIKYADRRMRILLDWGRLPHLMRVGKAGVRLSLSGEKWKVYSLSSGGNRRRELPCRVAGGELSFTADVAADPADASYLYELVRE